MAIVLISAAIILLLAIYFIVAKPQSKPATGNNGSNKKYLITWLVCTCTLTAWAALFSIALAMPDPEIENQTVTNNPNWLLWSTFAVHFILLPLVSLILILKKHYKIGLLLMPAPFLLFLLTTFL